MSPTSAEIQATERAAVAGVQGHRAGEIELVQGHGAVEDVLWEAGPRPLAWEWGGPPRFSGEGSPPPGVSSGFLRCRKGRGRGGGHMAWGWR